MEWIVYISTEFDVQNWRRIKKRAARSDDINIGYTHKEAVLLWMKLIINIGGKC